MPEMPGRREAASLTRAERIIAGVLGAVLLAVALVIVLAPPARRVALQQCPNAAAGCVVTVDDDVTTFAAILAGIGAIGALIAVLGIRFNQVKVAGAELGGQYEEETAGLAHAAPAADVEVNGPDDLSEGPDRLDEPVRVEIRQGLGEQLGSVPVAITRLTQRMRDVDPAFLRDYQTARKVSQQSHFLTHILGPATRPRQLYSVAIRVTPHKDAVSKVRSASFYLGRAWGHRVIEGRRGPDGRFGISTEAYGPFLALCEVEFDDGTRIVLDHYCDFDMGGLLPG